MSGKALMEICDGETLLETILSGGLDTPLRELYGSDPQALALQRARYAKAVREFCGIYGAASDGEPFYLLSVPGRSEVGGNHTDHNNGRVLACAVDLDIIAVARRNSVGLVRIQSEGFPMDTVDPSQTLPRAEEQFKSVGLIRGICAGAARSGFQAGGFDAYTTSRVLKGSGLSSSAAFEVMTASLLSHLYNAGNIDPVLMAKLSQNAEGEFFGKPCGLMDQTACAVGDFITIDFADTQNPVIEKLSFDFASTGHRLCIVDTGGHHADLNADYAAIRSEMGKIASLLGHTVLRECDENEFYSEIARLRKAAGDRAVLRALHFFGDNARVAKQVRALRAGDFQTFLSLVLESGRSSFMYLQNCYSVSNPAEQGLSLGLALAERVLCGSGAFRVHGGGFAGTIQAFVPEKKLDEFVAVMNGAFGPSCCYPLSVRTGPFRLL